MVFKKRTATTDKIFEDREIHIIASREDIAKIPVGNDVVLCNGCNNNIYPDEGWLVYLTRRELAKNQPYDFYCITCINKYFPKAVEA
jgi:hypothetical protein